MQSIPIDECEYRRSRASSGMLQNDEMLIRKEWRFWNLHSAQVGASGKLKDMAPIYLLAWTLLGCSSRWQVALSSDVDDDELDAKLALLYLGGKSRTHLGKSRSNPGTIRDKNRKPYYPATRQIVLFIYEGAYKNSSKHHDRS